MNLPRLSVNPCRTSRVLPRMLWLVIAAAGCGPGEPAAERNNAVAPPSPFVDPGYSTPFVTAGVKQPATLPAAEAQLADDAQVIGVTAGGRHRAYSVPAMSNMLSHVVNDLINDVPVTVTYCDQTDCTRVFIGDGTGPIDVWTGGWMNGEMSLRYQGRYFAQTAPEIPLPDHPFVVTSWKEWRAQHPDSDVYVGESSAPSGEPDPTSAVRAPHSGEVAE